MLFSQVESLSQVAVAIYVFTTKIIEQMSSLANKTLKSALGLIVMLIGTKMGT